MSNVTVTLVWKEPEGSGPETVVENYRISIYPASLAYPNSDVLTSSPSLSITVNYTQLYTVNLTAINCEGESADFASLSFEYGKHTGINASASHSTTSLLCIVNCGIPMSPINGSVDSPDHTREGASVNYRCDDGFRPSVNFTSTCENTTRWTPDPKDHNCTFVTGTHNTNKVNKN